MKGLIVNVPIESVSGTDDLLPDPMTFALVVDDSSFQRKIVVSMLESWGMTVLQAETGEAALALCATNTFDLVVSDWMMPQMNGLEFCRRFREETNGHYGYFILLTAKSEKDEVVRGLDAGADDFLSKPVNKFELRARITAGGRILSMERELQAKNQVISETLTELQKLYDGIDADLAQARTIQQSLVPQRTQTFGKSRISLLLQPRGHVGGDLVGMFSPGSNRLGFYNIDVSGHGVTSAMVTARVAGYLNGQFPEQNIALERGNNDFFALRAPHEVAAALNTRLCSDAGVAEYLTLLYATADLSAGHLKFVQAGHTHPLILRRDGTAQFFGTGGFPVGLMDDMVYDDTEVWLDRGDRVLLYSDGFTEATMPDGTMIGEAGFLDLIQRTVLSCTGTDFLDQLLMHLTEASPRCNGMEDDISAVLLEYDGP
ncbi:MAG: SpoIIE family protein phosphatase [Oceanicola sp.]|nr:SpoIIE family protein phosphatase [Oceanicola sp.]